MTARVLERAAVKMGLGMRQTAGREEFFLGGGGAPYGHVKFKLPRSKRWLDI